MLFLVLVEFFTDLLPRAINVIVLLSPIWGVLFLVIIFWNVWLAYVRADFLSKQEYILLEIVYIFMLLL